jgi:hypothetical protein
VDDEADGDNGSNDTSLLCANIDAPLEFDVPVVVVGVVALDESRAVNGDPLDCDSDLRSSTSR